MNGYDSTHHRQHLIYFEAVRVSAKALDYSVIAQRGGGEGCKYQYINY